ncbi:hypothetical protein OEB99_19630, partial [Actinotalea sp. M2MS4P-6]|uniref:hypothetical protein n=1 Tax=Actinotalea sp. M2MS4P-6 TaxID=2983762 RepID=UPI0021E3DF6D
RLELAGDSAVRVTELSTAGTVLSDRELAPGPMDLRPGCGMVAVTALGRSALPKDRADRPARPGAITGALASRGTAVLGWQVGTSVVQVGPTALLARGAVVRLGAPTGTRVRSHVAASGIATVSRAMLDQAAVQTDLPAHVTVVGVLLDAPTDALLGPEDVVVHVGGASLAPVPTQVAAGRRTAFLYDVTELDDGAETITVTVGAPDAALAGVVASDGSADEWAATLAGTTLTQLVPDEQLTPDGTVRVRLTKGGGTDG